MARSKGVTVTVGASAGRSTTFITDKVTQMLNERGTKHGNWEDNSRASRSFKIVIDEEAKRRVQRGQTPLTDSQREALEMIAHKMGRIIAGEASYYDHWDDIMGYAKLGKEGHQ